MCISTPGFSALLDAIENFDMERQTKVIIRLLALKS